MSINFVKTQTWEYMKWTTVRTRDNLSNKLYWRVGRMSIQEAGGQFSGTDLAPLCQSRMARFKLPAAQSWQEWDDAIPRGVVGAEIEFYRSLIFQWRSGKIGEPRKVTQTRTAESQWESTECNVILRPNGFRGLPNRCHDTNNLLLS